MLQGAIAGLAAGGTYAVIAVCLTLMSQLVRVINFSQAAVGIFGVLIAVKLIPLGIPQWVAVVIGIFIGAILSALIGWVIATWLPESSTTSRSAVTVAGLLFILAMCYIVFGTRPLPLKAFMGGPFVKIAGVTVSQVSVAMIVIAIVVAIAAKIILTKTSVGMQLRAISDRPTAAALLGVPVKRLSIGVWFVTGLVTTGALAIVVPTQSSDATVTTLLIVPAAAAALIGAFKRLDLAVIGGLALGALQGALVAFPTIYLLRDWIPIIVIIVFLLWNQRKEVWDVAR